MDDEAVHQVVEGLLTGSELFNFTAKIVFLLLGLPTIRGDAVSVAAGAEPPGLECLEINAVMVNDTAILIVLGCTLIEFGESAIAFGLRVGGISLVGFPLLPPFLGRDEFDLGIGLLGVAEERNRRGFGAGLDTGETLVG